MTTYIPPHAATRSAISTIPLFASLLVGIVACSEGPSPVQGADAGTEIQADAGIDPRSDANTDVDPASFVGDFQGEVHFQVSSLSDPDEPDVAGFHETAILVALADDGLDITFELMGVAVDETPPTCTLLLQVDGDVARLSEEQTCMVVVGNFEGTWTFQSGVLAVSEGQQLSFVAEAQMNEPNGYAGAYVYNVFGAPLQ